MVDLQEEMLSADHNLVKGQLIRMKQGVQDMILDCKLVVCNMRDNDLIRNSSGRPNRICFSSYCIHMVEIIAKCLGSTLVIRGS